MRDKKRRRWSGIETPSADEVDAPQVPVVGADEVARIIETALVPLRSHLSHERLDIIRSVLRSSIETDPVSRVLTQGALQTNTAIRKLPRELGAVAALAGSAAIANEIKK
jgi:hypothetical protein